jgi:Tol biopolymer transport system component
MINPNGKRFIFLHRWIKNGIKFDRLISSDMDGEDLYILLDDNMVSHCNWKDDETIITWANTKEYGNHYYLLIDKSENKEVFGEKILDVDGHPSFSPNGEYMITDTYPNFRLKQRLILYNLEKNEIQIIASVYANLKYMNETRCDLHPRWKRDSSEICFDGSQGEYRQIYTLNISDTNQK